MYRTLRGDIHVRSELRQSFVEVVHLCQDADCHYDHEHVRRRVCELVVPAKCELDGNTERFDRHDGHTAHSTADADIHQRILFAVFGRNPVYHEYGECGDEGAIEEEP